MPAPMSLHRLPLRTKLIAAIAVPLAGLLVVGALQTQTLAGRLGDAERQLAVVEVNAAIVEIAAAVRTERDVHLTVAGVPAGAGEEEREASRQLLSSVRALTDRRIADARRSEALDPSTQEVIDRLQQRLQEARAALGADLGAIQASLVNELRLTTLTDQGDATIRALAEFDAIVADTIELVAVDPGLDLDARTALALTTLRLTAEYDEALRLEALGYLTLSLIGHGPSPSFLVETRQQGSEAAVLEDLVREVGNTQSSAAFDDFLDGARYSRFRQFRDTVAVQRPGSADISQDSIINTLFGLTSSLNAVRASALDDVRMTATASQDEARRQLTLIGAALAALVVVIGAIALGLFRSIRRPLLTLTGRSRAIAEHELPEVVRLLREEGGAEEVPEIAPIEAKTDDEIGELVDAFNDMHHTAVQLAAEQAGSRRAVAEMFVNLGRRNQRLLMRILDYLDGLEQQEEDPETLERLFKIDHLVTRMRRNAESLLVLAGARESRVVEGAVPVVEVARSSLGEVEGYERVDVDIRDDAWVDGAVVADLAHLLAELVENGLSYSAPDTTVVVSAAPTSGGFVIAIADRGVGMSAEALAAANATIEGASSLEETRSSELGHHVVGRLATRHGIEVSLREGVTDGVVAKVWLPDAILTTAAPTSSPATSSVTAAPVSDAAVDSAGPELDEPDDVVGEVEVVGEVAAPSFSTPPPTDGGLPRRVVAQPSTEVDAPPPDDGWAGELADAIVDAAEPEPDPTPRRRKDDTETSSPPDDGAGFAASLSSFQTGIRTAADESVASTTQETER